MKNILTAALVLITSAFFVSTASAAEGDCQKLSEGIKALCGDEIHAAYAADPVPPTDAECGEFMAAVDKAVADHPGATEEEMVTFLVDVCLAIGEAAKQ
jgi:hypothetical protein